jgi:hypothetical protein
LSKPARKEPMIQRDSRYWKEKVNDRSRSWRRQEEGCERSYQQRSWLSTGGERFVLRD